MKDRDCNLQVYARQKAQMLSDHAFLSLLGVATFWALFSPSATISYGIGAVLGAVYLFLLQRQTDTIGASSLEDGVRCIAVVLRAFTAILSASPKHKHSVSRALCSGESRTTTYCYTCAHGSHCRKESNSLSSSDIGWLYDKLPGNFRTARVSSRL